MVARGAYSVRTHLLQIWEESARSGSPLPPEAQLAETLGVSRPHAREELSRLEGEGLVLRQAGSGTYPNRAALGMGLRLNQSFEFAEMLEEAGHSARTEVLEAGWTTLGAEDAGRLEQSPGASAYRTVKRWLADDVPAMLAVDLIPSRRQDEDIDPSDSVFAIVDRLRGVRSEWEMTEVHARTPTAREREILELPSRRAAVLDLEITGMTLRGMKIYHSRESHRQGSLRYGLIRRVRS